MPTWPAAWSPRWGLPAGRAAGRPAGHRRRRPGAARRAARDLHRRGRRHPGAARPETERPPAMTGSVPTSQQRPAGAVRRALMNTFGPPRTGAGPRRGLLRLGRRRQPATSTCSAASPSTPSATPTRRWSRPSPRSCDARPRLELLRHRAAGRARRAAARGWPARRRRGGVLHQLRRRGQRGRVQADPPHRPHPHGRHGGRASTAARWARSRSPPRRPTASRSSRCPATSPSCRTATPTRSPRRSPTRPRPSSSSRSRARPAWSSRRTGFLPRPASSPPRTARCCGSTRCRPGIGRTGAGSRTSRPGVAPDVVTLAKGLGGGIPIGAMVASGEAPACSAPATTARRSAATRSPAPPPSRSSTRSSKDGLLDNADRGRASGSRRLLARPPAGHRGARPRAVPRPRPGRRGGPAVAEGGARRRVHPQRLQPDAIRLVPPLVLTAGAGGRLLAALRGLLDEQPGDAA